MKVHYFICINLIVLLLTPFHLAQAASEKKLPDTVHNISEKNTAEILDETAEKVEPNEQVKAMLAKMKSPINNNTLIEILNETTIKPGLIPIGHKSAVYLGRWPLHYTSANSKLISDYHLVNQNELHNSKNGKDKLTYLQYETVETKGALQNKTEDAAAVKQMMVEIAQRKWQLPLQFTAIIGESTNLTKSYDVGAKKSGKLSAYIPAVYEQGDLTYGDVYIDITGKSVSLKIKNVTKQKMSAWIPVINHITLIFETKEAANDE